MASAIRRRRAAAPSPSNQKTGLSRDLRKIRHRVNGVAQLAEQAQAIEPQLGIVGVDGDLEEEFVDRRTQPRQRAHRALEVFAGDALRRFRARAGERGGERLLFRQRERARVVRFGEGAFAVLLLLGAQDVGGAAIAGEQVLAVVAVEQFARAPRRGARSSADRPGPAREHRVDQIVPRALVAQIDFQAVGEEGEEIVDARRS